MSSDQKANVQPPADRVYEDFDPPFDWDDDQTSHTLIVMLPGFKKEQLRVQITSTRILKLSGERQIRDNKWRRFRKDLSLPPDSDNSGISAKFEIGTLYVRIPKKQQPPTTTPTQQTQETPKPPQQPAPEAPPHAHVDQQKPRVDKAEEAKTTEAPPPPPIAPLQEPKANELDSQKKPRVVDKAAEAKTEAPAPTPVAPLQEPKAHEDSQKKPHKDKGKEEIDAKKVAKERGEATTSKAQEMHDGLVKGKGEAKIDKRSPTMELLSRQTQEYKNALSDLMEKLRNQKKLANLVVVIFLVLVFVMYVKNAIKSSFEGSKSQEL